MKKSTKLGLFTTLAIAGGLTLAGCSPLEAKVTETVVKEQARPTFTEEYVEPTATATVEPTAEPTVEPTEESIYSTPPIHDTESAMPLDSRLAFVAQDQDYIYDIWTTDGSELKRLTADTIYEHSLTWSPDGKSIAYITSDQDTKLDIIRLIDVETGDLKDIYSSSNSLWNLDWSIENSLIVFAEKVSDNMKDITKINTINPVSGKKTNVTQTENYVHFLEWMDNDTIFFQDVNKHEIYSLDLDGEISLIKDNINSVDISWNKKQLVFNEYPEPEQINLTNLENNSQTIISHEDIYISGMMSLNDDSLIYFSSPRKQGEYGVLHVKYDSDGNKIFEENILDLEMIGRPGADVGYLEGASLSIDDGQLLFVLWNYSGADNQYLLSTDGTHLRKLNLGQDYPFFASMSNFAWSPIKEELTLERDEDIKIINDYDFGRAIQFDGNLLFIAEDQNDKTDWWSLDGDNLERLPRDVYNGSNMQVTPLGDKLFFTAMEWNYTGTDDFNIGYTMEFDGSDKKEIFRLERTDHEKGFGHFQLSPDETLVSLVEASGYGRDRQLDLYLLNLESSELVLLREDISSYDWSPDGKNILMTTDEKILLFEIPSEESPSLKNISFINLSGGYYGRSGSFDSSEIKYSPDGSHVAISVTDGIKNRIYVGEVNIEEQMIENLNVMEDNYSGHGFSWRPDGQTILYSTYNETTNENGKTEYRSQLVESILSGNFSWIIDSSVTEDRSIFSPDEFYSYYSPIFSPDGNTIVFQQSEHYSHLYCKFFTISRHGDKKQIPFGENSSLRCLMDGFGDHESQLGYEFIPE